MTKEEIHIESIYNNAFHKMYPPSNTIWERWCFIDWLHIKRTEEDGTSNKPKVIRKIKELLDGGYKVKCGKASTSVRGYYAYFIFYKK